MTDLILGCCKEELRKLISSGIQVDSIITDPPYELGFMGKTWDKSGIANDSHMWKLCLQVLKPGGHLLSFGGTRTYHRMTCAIEDAGFEIRDCIQWIYGSGFPKSMNIGKKLEDYKGFGTALKPAHEPIVFARKPLSEKTIVDNVLKHGTGAINIDDCRVGSEGGTLKYDCDKGNSINTFANGLGGGKKYKIDAGRFPANVIHDGSDEVEAEFARFGEKPSGRSDKDAGYDKEGSSFSTRKLASTGRHYSDGGSSSRFFYCAKASKKDRGENNSHPTVKPFELMRYLCRLITPPGGTILDPFMGSGSTGVAAKDEKFKFIGIEKEESYLEIARKRMHL